MQYIDFIYLYRWYSTFFCFSLFLAHFFPVIFDHLQTLIHQSYFIQIDFIFKLSNFLLHNNAHFRQFFSFCWVISYTFHFHFIIFAWFYTFHFFLSFNCVPIFLWGFLVQRKLCSYIIRIQKNFANCRISTPPNVIANILCINFTLFLFCFCCFLYDLPSKNLCNRRLRCLYHSILCVCVLCVCVELWKFVSVLMELFSASR